MALLGVNPRCVALSSEGGQAVIEAEREGAAIMFSYPSTPSHRHRLVKFFVQEPHGGKARSIREDIDEQKKKNRVGLQGGRNVPPRMPFSDLLKPTPPGTRGGYFRPL